MNGIIKILLKGFGVLALVMLAGNASAQTADEFFQLAKQSYEKRELLKSEAYFRRALRADPQHLDSYVQLMELFIIMSRYEEALLVAEDAEQNLGINPRILVEKSLVYREMNQLSAALTVSKEAYALAPGDLVVMDHLEGMYRFLDNEQAADGIREKRREIEGDSQ